MTGYEIGDFLCEYICNNFNVLLELGSGEGSQRLVDGGVEVHSIEYNDKYLNKYNTIYYYVPLSGKWFNPTMLKAALKTVPDYECLLIDAPAAFNGDDRKGILDHIYLFDTEKTVIVDDVHRKSEMELAMSISAITERGIRIYQDGSKMFGVI
jgi:hypothetical protein